MSLNTILLIIHFVGAPFVLGFGNRYAKRHKDRFPHPWPLAVGFYGAYTFVYLILLKVLSMLGILAG